MGDAFNGPWSLSSTSSRSGVYKGTFKDSSVVSQPPPLDLTTPPA